MAANSGIAPQARCPQSLQRLPSPILCLLEQFPRVLDCACQCVRLANVMREQ